MVNQLLTEMDGLEERRGVFVIAATNRPDIIDPAMLRPGRLDKLLYVPLPTKEDRFSILKTVCRRVPLSQDVDLMKIAYDSKCEGYSGADLSALVREAQMCTLKALVLKDEHVVASGGAKDGQSTAAKVTMKDFMNALTRVLPSVSKRDEGLYRALEGSLRKSRSTLTATGAAGSAADKNESAKDLNNSSRKPNPHMRH